MVICRVWFLKVASFFPGFQKYGWKTRLEKIVLCGFTQLLDKISLYFVILIIYEVRLAEQHDLKQDKESGLYSRNLEKISRIYSTKSQS